MFLIFSLVIIWKWAYQIKGLASAKPDIHTPLPYDVAQRIPAGNGNVTSTVLRTPYCHVPERVGPVFNEMQAVYSCTLICVIIVGL